MWRKNLKQFFQQVYIE